ncbi:hypothetical protein ONZ45_g5100 [Pleurotus djamor]|nr:hypothetical protein ONZ45_g5100 [Pleurotus djamor]
MYTSNPYASWQSGSGSYAFPRGAGAPTPSIFGALPFSASAPSSNAPMVAFTFTFNTSILSCSVIGPQNKVYYQIATDTPRPGFTFIHNASSSVVAIVEWQQHPIIEIRNIVPKQYASQWVILNSHGK